MQNVKYLFLLVGIGLLSSCAKAPVDADLAPYVNSFEAILGKTVSFPVRFSESLDPQYAGVCIVYDDGTREIQINKYSWGDMGDDGHQETVYHELGHCELGRGHISDFKGDGTPVSIMYPVVFGDQSFYSDNRQYYISELFANKNYQYDELVKFSPPKSDGDYQYKTK